MTCDPKNLPSLVHTPQSKFKSSTYHKRKCQKLEVSVGHFIYTCIPEEEAVHNSHVQEVNTFCLLPVLSQLKLSILVFVAFTCFLHAEMPGDICGSSIVTIITSAFISFLGILSVSFAIQTCLYTL
jgi:hypothetical protein